MKEIKSEFEVGSFNDFNEQTEELVEKNNRYGRLFVKEQWYVRGNEEQVQALYKEILITRCEFLYHSHIFDIFCYSEQFDELDEDIQTFPIYDVYFRDGKIEFERREDE